MILRRLTDVEGSERSVSGPTFTSRRLLLRDDGLGFSLHDTVIAAGSRTDMFYRHHVEAVYCLEGHGRLVDHDHGTTHDLAPGTLYVLDGHEHHTVEAQTELRMVCVFTPALRGDELHDEHGTYPLAEVEPT